MEKLALNIWRIMCSRLVLSLPSKLVKLSETVRNLVNFWLKKIFRIERTTLKKTLNSINGINDKDVYFTFLQNKKIE